MTHCTTRACAAVALASITAAACATGLQVSPTHLQLAGPQAALWLSDSGTAPVHAQVRVYRWTQTGGKDVLTASHDIAASPPMATIQPGAKQLVRVIRTTTPTGAETAYRLAVDELPIAAPGAPGLHFIVHYSVPVFVEPANTKALAPMLQWKVQGRDVAVTNTGSKHVQLAAVSVTGADGRAVTVSPGLLGYVLPGATMKWRLPRVVSEPTTTTAQVNGFTQSFTLVAGHHAGAAPAADRVTK